MARSAVLNISIVSDARGAAAGFSDAETRVQRFERGLDRASGAAAGLLAGIGALAVQAIDSASRLEQSTGAIGSVFGDYASEIEQAAKGAASTLGLSQSAYQDMAAVFGASLQNMGMDAQTASAQTQQLISLGADLAATYGGTTADAVAALGSLLRGETDPIERYGVGMKQADINARLAAMGMEDLEGEAGKLAQAQAVLGLLTEQTTGALGASAREAGTVASQTAAAKAEWDNAAASLGQVLLPIASQMAGKLAELATWFVANKDAVLPVIAVVGGLAAGILVLNGAMKAYAVVQTLVNAVINASPLMRLVAVIVAIVGVVVLMYQKFEWFRNLVSVLGNVFSTVFGWIMRAIQPVVDIIDWIADKLSWIGDAASWVGDLFSAPMQVQVSGSGAMMGAAAGMRGAPLIAGAGGVGVGPGAAGPGSTPGMIVNVTVNGAIDPVSTGRQIEKVLRDYGRATGRQVALAGRP